MPKHTQIVTLGEGLVDIAKDLVKVFARFFGRLFGVGIAAAIFGGAGGGIAAAVYGGPIIGFAIGGAVVSVIAVYALWLLVMSDY